MDDKEQHTLQDVYAKIEYSILPSLVSLTAGMAAINNHLIELNGTVAKCVTADAVSEIRLKNLEACNVDVEQRQEKSDKRTIYDAAWRNYMIKVLLPIVFIIVAGMLTYVFSRH